MRRPLAFAAVTFALASGAAAAAARAAGPPVIEETVVAPAPDPITTLLHTQVGSWQCTIAYPGLRDSERFVVVWSGFGDHYIRGTADVPAFRQEPERKVNVILGYDTGAKQWTNAFTDSTGAFALFKSTSGAPNKKIALTQAYPDDSDVGPSTVVLGPRTTTIDNSWKVSGTQRESHEVCAKIPV
jgi:hypothetical protein